MQEEFRQQKKICNNLRKNSNRSLHEIYFKVFRKYFKRISWNNLRRNPGENFTLTRPVNPGKIMKKLLEKSLKTSQIISVKKTEWVPGWISWESLKETQEEKIEELNQRIPKKIHKLISGRILERISEAISKENPEGINESISGDIPEKILTFLWYPGGLPKRISAEISERILEEPLNDSQKKSLKKSLNELKCRISFIYVKIHVNKNKKKTNSWRNLKKN